MRQLFAADDFSRQHFQMHFFPGALRLNISLAGGQSLKRINHECEARMIHPLTTDQQTVISIFSNKSLPVRIYFDSNMQKD